MAYDAEHLQTGLNVRAITALADFLETLPPEKFDMSDWAAHDPECGTVACIGGWALIRAGKDPKKTIGYLDKDKEAAKILGLTQKQRLKLFYVLNAESFCAHENGMRQITPMNQITTAQAVKTLRHLAATGEVDWSHVP